MRLIARSISRTAKATVQHQAFSARVLAVFDQVCDLATPKGDVVALVLPGVGNGPLNIVVQAELGELAATVPGTPAWLDGDMLRIGDREVALEHAPVWEPCPDWSAHRARLQAITAGLPALRAFAQNHAPAGSLLATLDTTSPHVALSQVRNSGPEWESDFTHLWQTAIHLAGRGIGLTPAGDDFLAGVMLWAWLAHPAPGPVCQTLVEVAAPRTTTLSAAFLRAAARGECDANWHRRLAALSTGDIVQLAPAVQQVAAHGATSGADMLAGFLWLAVG